MGLTPAEKAAFLALMRVVRDKANKKVWDSLEPRHQQKLHHLAMVLASNYR